MKAEATPRPVSVIVPCRNEATALPAFMTSLLAQEHPGLDVEVLVADGQSEDGSRDLLLRLADEHPAVRLVDNPGRIVSTGLNAAVRAARGDIILRMDVHTTYAPDYIVRCVECLEFTGADNVGGAARTRPAAGALARALSAAYHSPFACGGALFHDASHEGPVDTVPYGCWRRDTLLRLGLFDETLVRNQDDELNLRMSLAGLTIWQSPAIISWYRPRASLAHLFRQYLQYGFWKVAVIRKHRRPASWRHLVPGAFVMAVALLPLLAVLAWAAGSAGTARILLAIWGLMVGIYLAASGLAALLAARQAGWDAAVLLPAVFAAYHVSYGLGFLAGILYWPFRQPGKARLPRLFAALTR